jgi:hypothetical protein
MLHKRAMGSAVNLMIYQHRNNYTCKEDGDHKAKNPGYDERKFRRAERLTFIPKHIMPKHIKTDKLSGFVPI